MQKDAAKYDHARIPLKHADIVEKLSLEEKASLCSGKDMWHFKGIERLGIPEVMVTDGPHGLRKQEEKQLLLNQSVKATCFPTAVTTACSWDEELLEYLGRTLGEEAVCEGVRVVLGPGMNIKRDPLCGRNFEYFSEDPYLAGKMSAAMVRGIQENGTGACPKHYCCNNQEYYRMSISAEVDERALRELYLAPFETVVKEAAPQTMMCAYNKINGVYASENPLTLNEIPRGEWGFAGLMMTDWGATADRVKGAAAGMDVEMPSSGGMNDKKLVAAVQAGELDERVLDVIADRVIDLALTSPARKEGGYDADAHDKVARKVAAASAVLLQNDGMLPLDESEKVLFIGQMTLKPRFQGAGSSFINAHKITSVADALGERGLRFAYEQGYETEKCKKKQSEKLLQKAADMAAKYKNVVIMAGLPPSFEAEGFDRSHMCLPDEQNELIERVAAVNPNVAVVISGGGAVEMPWADKVRAVLFMGLAGQCGGAATVDLLYGFENPSGKLAESFPVKYEDAPSAQYFPGKRYYSEYREGIFVGYRYYATAGVKPRFAFGHGLSYTSFEYSNLRLGAEKIREGEGVEVTFTLKNSGARDGAEVAQIYVAAPKGGVYVPAFELKGSKKVFLRAGEERTVSITLPARAFMYWNVKEGDWCAQNGEYTVWLGAASDDFKAQAKVFVSAPEHKTADAGGWYASPSPERVGDEDFAALLGRPINKEKPLPKKGEFTMNDSFNDMSATSGFARFIIKVSRGIISLSMHAPADDPNCKMMHEVMITSPLRSLSFSSQGMFNEKMADGLLLMLNGKFFKGLGRLIANIGKK